VAGGACIGLGIGPTQIDKVMGLFKAYLTRVGAGPFPTELLNGEGDELRELGAEYGTTTGRARRCGWFDGVLARHAVRVNGMQRAAISKLDVLDSLTSIKLCTGYRLDGKTIDYLPASLATYARCEPIWEEFPGWQQPSGEARSIADLPARARDYLDALSHQIGCPIDLVSVGSHRRQTIVVNPSFA
jgi:adenylosuccinate synthase